MITELVGPAGVGKTQACLMLAAQACLPVRLGGLGEDAGVVYVDTERKVHSERGRNRESFREFSVLIYRKRLRGVVGYGELVNNSSCSGFGETI